MANKKRLIDANEVVKTILAERDKIHRTVPAAPYDLVPVKPNQNGNLIRGGIRKALRCIEQAPTIDAVPVVRCLDCKHSFILGDSLLATEAAYSYYKKDCLMCGCESLMGDIPNAVYADFYCGYGDRKEGADNA